MAIIAKTVIIDGTKYTREIDTEENAKIRRYEESEAVMRRIGYCIDSYAVSTIKSRTGKMAGAKAAQNQKGTMSRKTESANRIVREQRKITKLS